MASADSSADVKKVVLERYNEHIAFYLRSAKRNKRSYKTTRLLIIVLGALVTLVSSLASADFIKSNPALATTFAILTPMLAAIMAIAGGVAQSFQWGAVWSEMSITAAQIERERDRIAVTPAGEINGVKEMQVLDDLVVTETQNFFQRLFGTGAQPTNPQPKSGPSEPRLPPPGA
jgi:hypothetical protein